MQENKLDKALSKFVYWKPEASSTSYRGSSCGHCGGSCHGDGSCSGDGD